MQKEGQDIQVFWFRRDLRLTDNVGLYNALQDKRYPVFPLFIFDTDILSSLPSTYDKRVDYIHQILTSLNQELHQLGSSLMVEIGKPTEVFEKLTTQFTIKAVHTNSDYEPYAIQRDKEVRSLLHTKGITLHTYTDQVIFAPGEVIKADGSPYTIFTPFSKIWLRKYEQLPHQEYTTDAYKKNWLSTPAQEIPSLAKCGFKKTSIQYTPPSIPYSIIDNYTDTRNFPAINGTSTLSIHLRFGTISIRQLARIAFTRNHTYVSELIWRDFFMQILYFFPHVQTNAFKPKYDAIEWRNDTAEFSRWCNGTTGYPLVDAGMRQLNETGWMHNRVRMVAASFLCKHLLVDWRWGEAYFATKLMDYDLSANNGNWQWAAGCGCDAAPYFRVFNPTEQAKKFDSNSEYIRQWIPEVDTNKYATPIVEHTFARNRAIETYKKAISG